MVFVSSHTPTLILRLSEIQIIISHNNNNNQMERYAKYLINHVYLKKKAEKEKEKEKETKW